MHGKVKNSPAYCMLTKVTSSILLPDKLLFPKSYMGFSSSQIRIVIYLLSKGKIHNENVISTLTLDGVPILSDIYLLVAFDEL